MSEPAVVPPEFASLSLAVDADGTGTFRAATGNDTVSAETRPARSVGVERRSRRPRRGGNDPRSGGGQIDQRRRHLILSGGQFDASYRRRPVGDGWHALAASTPVLDVSARALIGLERIMDTS